MKLNDSTYERLSPDQRFRVTIEAFSRMDIEEVDRLQDTCGFVSVREHAPAYFGRLRMFIDLSMQHGIRVRDLAIAFWALMYFDNLRAGQEGTEQQETVESPEVGDAADPVGQIIGRLKGVQAAWQTFCQELAIDPQMWGQCAADYTGWAKASELLGYLKEIEVESNAAEYNQHLDLLRHGWQRCLNQTRGIENLESPRLAKNGRQ